MKFLGLISMDFNETGQKLVKPRYILHLSSTFRKNGNTMRQCISCLKTSRNPMIQLGGSPCIIFSLNLVSQETCNYCIILLRMLWKKEMLFHHCFSTLLFNITFGGLQQTRVAWNWMVHISIWFMLIMLI